MSISTQSYESIFKLAQAFYDPNMPLYFINEHIDMTCDVILLLLQCKTIKLVKTNMILQEPIVENNNIVYISVPLVAQLVNDCVELPKNNVEFLKDEHFDIFKELNYGVKTDDSKNQSSNCSIFAADEDFKPNERIRFIQTLRIILMCGHFYQHYNEKIPYHVHNKSMNHLEHAVQKHCVADAVGEKKIDYSLVSNM
ncbi:GrBNV gp60-like protein [Tomelloso virus]|uniref:GrBNV gp60-like protein n=1 Tax=Tomelloso virus TaxID=2053981 RepID=A0A2H4T2Y0_9VIRU|nr:GrBNV gp60-like protein [Tomelloso virus]ATY70239.1 GrBNV gp60-like protein [Tomelloso virus]